MSDGASAFGPLRAALPDSACARFAHVGTILDVRVYRNLDTGRELALDGQGRAHDLIGGAYWPVSRADAIRYALGEIHERPMPGR